MDAIVAVYSDWGIGCCGTQPLVIPADRAHFREITGGGALIYGRRTLSDFPGGRPLKNRTNIVLTRSCNAIDGAETVHSVKEALDAVRGIKRVFVIGGASVYRQLLPYCNKVYITKIEALPESDVFFENLDASLEWACIEHGKEFEHEGIKYRFMVYERVVDMV